MEARGSVNDAPVLAAFDLAVTPPGARHPAVAGVSLSVERGEWLALEGVNGGGKTSVVLALAGLWPASGGRVELLGEAFGPGAPERLRAAVACVMQDPSAQLLQPTVAEEIAFALVNLGWSPPDVVARTREIASRLALAPLLARDPRQLSAGWQQRVLLAAALAPKPRVLIADEPGAHLDAGARAALLKCVAGEVACGLAVVWVTQHAVEAARARRVLRIGPAPAPARPLPHAAASAAGDPVAVVSVRPTAATSGPNVRIDRPLRFEIPSRGVTALLGPNGIGKSVLLSAIVGVEAPDGIEVSARRPFTPPPLLALQFPELQVFEERVEDEVLYAAIQRGVPRPEARARVSAAFERLGLPPERWLTRRTWDLSTGEKRLIEVLGALIAPAVLVALDEPTAGLDDGHRQGLVREVALRAADTPVVVASQDLDWVRVLGAREVDLGIA